MRKAMATIGVTAAVAGGVVATQGAGPDAVQAARAPGHPPGLRFAGRVDNPWFPLAPGTTLVYRGIKDGKHSRDVFDVSHATTVVDGVRCTVVSDRLYLEGRLEERTTDWYAQDVAGNVWYFGEDTAELDARGHVRSRSGTWRAGRDGARAGIFMPAHPHVGQTGIQEYLKGQAEDHFRIRGLRARVRTPGASSHRALLTEEWTPLEPGVIDHKYYVRGVGTVLEKTVKGGDELNRLVSVRRG
jgi:hypothetical protein